MSQAGLVSEAGTGTVTNFSFTDANGFDGTVTNPTTTPNLTLNTTVADTRVMFSNLGAITGDAEMTYNSTTNVLSIANLTANGNLQQYIHTSQAATDAIDIQSSAGGIKIQTAGGGPALGDIIVNASSSSVRILAVENVTDAIDIIANPGGINISASLGIYLDSGLSLGQANVSTTPFSVAPSDYLYSIDSTAGAITLNLPAGIGGATYCFYHRAGANDVIIDANGTEVIRLGNTVTSAGGTATSALVGDSITFTYNSTGGFWQTTSVIGTWTLA